MTARADFPPGGGRIRLLLSDVDGTLVTTDKRLTEASCAAARRLAAVGIGFTITSSRPPFGMRVLIEALDLKLPMGAYSGGALFVPGIGVLEQHMIDPAAAVRAIEILSSRGMDIWAFSGQAWLLTNPAGPYVDHERRTILSEPVVVERFDDHIAQVSKIVGVSADFERLKACEIEVQAALAGTASVVRSQDYYLDVTPLGVDKGTVVDALARRLGIPHAEIATIGDMDNDLPMFRKAGFRIAMGNASPAVKAEADAITTSNEEDGFAAAIERYVLPRAPG
jgi:Cof subfamily protein (haloacid dehalogenase superfamily)